MLKPDYFKKLNDSFAKLLKSHGIDAPLRMEQAGYDLCVVRIPKEVDDRWHDEISVVEDEFADTADEDVLEVDDRQREKGVKKGGFRWFVIGVSADVSTEGPEDEAVLQSVKAAMHGRASEPVMDSATGLIPIPPAPKNASTEVYLPLRYEPFDQIASGEKKTEFREYTPHWVKQLLSRPIKTVKFQRGYDAGAAQMTWTVKNVELYNMENRRSAKPTAVPKGFRPTHIAIDLGARIA